MTDVNTSDVNQTADEQVTAPVEASTTDNKDTAMTSDFDKLWDKETTTPPHDPEEEIKTRTEDTDTENQEDGDTNATSVDKTGDDETETEQAQDDSSKRDANARIRQLANENRDLKRQIEEANIQHYRTQTKDELVEQGMSEAEARVEALEQRMEMEKHIAEQAALNTALEAESQQVLREFPMFDPSSEEYKPEIAKVAQSLYQKAAGLKADDKTGFYTEANILPYEFYKAFADSHKLSMTDGQIAGQRAAQKNYANADLPSSKTPKPAEKDPIAQIWESDD